MSLYSYGEDAAAANQAKIDQAEGPTTNYIKLDSILIKKSSVQASSRSPVLDAQIHPNPREKNRKSYSSSHCSLVIKNFKTYSLSLSIYTHRVSKTCFHMQVNLRAVTLLNINQCALPSSFSLSMHLYNFLLTNNNPVIGLY